MLTNKKYLLFGGTQGIGGFQLYTAARFQHIQELGYDVFVFDAGDMVEKNIKLRELQSNHCFFMEELNLPPYCFRPKEQQKVVEKVKRMINYCTDDDVFVEACSLPYAIWGELFSREMKGVCFAYILSSHTENTPRDLQEYCSFKYDQNLIAGQTDITLPDLFEGFRDVSSDKRELPPSWKSPICEDREDCKASIDIIKLYKSEGYKIIGYFGTLSKPHFEKLCKYIEEYVGRYLNKKFLFLSVGSSPGEKSEMRQKIIKKTRPNCDVKNIPELYPVPRAVFAMMDVCLGSWGSASVAALGCERVIRLTDDVDIIPQGIIGITLNETPYYKLPVGQDTLDELFDKILWGDNYIGVPFVKPEFSNKNEDMQMAIDSYMAPFSHDKKSMNYYNIDLIFPPSLIKKIMKICGRTIGVGTTLKIRMIAKNVQYMIKSKQSFFAVLRKTDVRMPQFALRILTSDCKK